MMAIPAVDLRDGACVQLVGGDVDDERVRLDHPVEVARAWIEMGFRRLHLVDLDAATGRGALLRTPNAESIRAILGSAAAPVQVGGGVREEDDVEALVLEGASQVIIGTRALEDPDWMTTVACAHPGRMILAADVRQRTVVTRGWSRSLGLRIEEVMERCRGLPLAGLLVTAVHREGRLNGVDLPLMEDVVEAADVPVIAAGGVTSFGDLHALADCGVSAVVLGMALYTGTLNARAVALEFAA
jgi:phosphoribosylformimino-5-aminoimidazole carboxamide ribotide isomerase